MNKAFKFETADIKWGYNMEWFERWKEGKTGFPIGDTRKLLSRKSLS